MRKAWKCFEVGRFKRIVRREVELDRLERGTAFAKTPAGKDIQVFEDGGC